MWDDQPYKDFAPISGLSLNRNIVELRITPGKNKGEGVHVASLPRTSFAPIQNEAITTSDIQQALFVMRDWRNKQNTITVSGQVPLASAEQTFLRNIASPALYAGTVFMEECLKLGITVANKPTLGQHQPTPLLLPATPRNP
jgi:D-alanyl-D-alanine carboxypeptidase